MRERTGNRHSLILFSGHLKPLVLVSIKSAAADDENPYTDFLVSKPGSVASYHREIVMASINTQLSLKGTSETTAADLCSTDGIVFGGEMKRSDRFASINEQSANNLWAPTSYQHAKPGVGKRADR